MWILKEEIKILGLEVTYSLVMVKDSHTSVHIYRSIHVFIEGVAIGAIKTF